MYKLLSKPNKSHFPIYIYLFMLNKQGVRLLINLDALDFRR